MRIIGMTQLANAVTANPSIIPFHMAFQQFYFPAQFINTRIHIWIDGSYNSYNSLRYINTNERFLVNLSSFTSPEQWTYSILISKAISKLLQKFCTCIEHLTSLHLPSLWRDGLPLKKSGNVCFCHSVCGLNCFSSPPFLHALFFRVQVGSFSCLKVFALSDLIILSHPVPTENLFSMITLLFISPIVFPSLALSKQHLNLLRSFLP